MRVDRYQPTTGETYAPTRPVPGSLTQSERCPRRSLRFLYVSWVVGCDNGVLDRSGDGLLMPSQAYLQADWRREALRTNLWVVPTTEAVMLSALFVGTYAVDRGAYHGALHLPSWVLSGTADSARQILTAVAAAIITVVGIVFSITIVALTLASTQFGPRMLRNFIRDRGTQITLGTFVATFFYTILTLVSVGSGSAGEFVPHLSITVALALTVADLAVLIYFLNHVASMIQLPQVIAGIAADLAREIDAQYGGPPEAFGVGAARGPTGAELIERIDSSGAAIRTPSSGYLQVIRHASLVKIATSAGAVIHLPYRPGHFLVRGQVLANVWPAEAAEYVEKNLQRGHVTGPYRTLTQDISFGFDQLVEIALRALSPAVNDTFTAMTCVDWIGDCLCRISTTWHPQRIRRDDSGQIRLIAYQADFDRLVGRAFEKIRQAANDMPAVMIRQLDALTKIMEQTPHRARQRVLLDQAERIQRANLRTVDDAGDRRTVTEQYNRVLLAMQHHRTYSHAGATLAAPPRSCDPSSRPEAERSTGATDLEKSGPM